MGTVLVIGSASFIPTEDERHYYDKYVEFFQQAINSQGGQAEVVTALLEDLIIEVGEGVFKIFDTRNNRELNSYTALIMRSSKFRISSDVVATISEYGQRYNIPVINESLAVRNVSKLLQAVHFELIGVPVALTLNVNNALLTNFDVVGEWSFPCVMKARFGSHGNNNYIVSSLEEVKEIQMRAVGTTYILQRFIPNDGDYRILSMGDEMMIIKRLSKGDSHLNNTSKGASAEEVDVFSLPSVIIDDSRKIVAYYSLQIAGVDVIQDKTTGDYFFLEVNIQPQLMTGAFADKKQELIGLLLKKF